MISVCTVVDKPQIKHFELFTSSILKRSSIITDVYIALIINKITKVPKDYVKKINNINFNYFEVYVPEQPHWISFKHSIGLHKCMERVQTEYIMLSDADILFLYPKFDEFLLSTFEQNNLNIIGIQMYKISRWKNFRCSYGSFPSIHNCLIKTSTLPDYEMFKGKLEVWRGPGRCDKKRKCKSLAENHYLICGCIPEYTHLYPLPNGHYDTGCKLLIWNKLKNGRWLTFCPGAGEVPLNNWKSNAKDIILPPYENRPLLYHQGGIWEGSTYNDFLKVYKNNFGEIKLL